MGYPVIRPVNILSSFQSINCHDGFSIVTVFLKMDSAADIGSEVVCLPVLAERGISVCPEEICCASA